MSRKGETLLTPSVHAELARVLLSKAKKIYTLLFRERVPSSRSHLHRYRHTDRKQRRIFTFLACPLLLFFSPPRKFNPTETVSSQRNQHSVFAARTRHTGRRVRRDKRVKGFGISLPLSPRVFARLKCSSRHLLWPAVHVREI